MVERNVAAMLSSAAKIVSSALLIGAFVSTSAFSQIPDPATVEMAEALDVGDFAAAERAIADGANINEPIGGRPLYFTYIRNGRDEQLEFALEHGADVNASTMTQRSPMHEAALWGRIRIAELLLEHGAEPCLPNARGETPLHYATNGLFVGPELTEDHAVVADLLRANGCTVTKVSE